MAVIAAFQQFHLRQLNRLDAEYLPLKPAGRVPLKIVGGGFLPGATPFLAEPSKNTFQRARLICTADADFTLPENANQAPLIQSITAQNA
jgi:hypothetical protein